MLEHLLNVALFSLGKGGSNMEETVLLFELELSCFSHGLEPCFGVYSGSKSSPARVVSTGDCSMLWVVRGGCGSFRLAM